MSLRDDSVIQNYSESGNRLISEIDGCQIVPEDFFTSNRIGNRILYLSYFPGINKYGKQKECVDFAYRNVSPKQIKEYIIRYQIDYLKWLDCFPTVNSPATSEKIMMDGRIIGSRANVTSIYTKEYAKEIYLEMFADRVKAMLIGKKENCVI